MIKKLRCDGGGGGAVGCGRETRERAVRMRATKRAALEKEKKNGKLQQETDGNQLKTEQRDGNINSKTGRLLGRSQRFADQN